MGMTMTLFQVNQNTLQKTIENQESFFEIDPDGECDSLNIDKSWDGIKFLLKQMDSQDQKKRLDQVISSSQKIGEFEEYDIYEVNYLTDKQIKEFITDLE